MFAVNPRACLKFEANVFDRSRCQNCFKPFDLHREDRGRDDSQLHYGNLSPCLHTSTLNQGDLRLISPDYSLHCGPSPEEVTASWQDSRMHNHLTSQISRRWAVDSPARISGSSGTADARGHSLRGEWMLGPSSTMMQESRNRDAHSERSTWAQLRSRMTSGGSRGSETVTGDPASGRKPRVESGYFSLERAKTDSIRDPARRPVEAQGAGQSGSSLRGPTTARGRLLALGHLMSSQSSFESESSWGTVTSSEPRPFRRDYTALADIPKAKRIISRERLEQDCKQLGQRTRTRSPGREEVERLFGQERRPVTESRREFITSNVGRARRESTASHRLEEDSSKVYPRKFPHKEPDRVLSKQASSFSMKAVDTYRHASQQRDKVDSKTYSQKDELKMCTKYSRSASEMNKVETNFSECSLHPGYLRTFTRNDWAERGFSPKSSPTSTHKDVYPRTADQHEPEKGFPNRTTSNSLNKDVRQQATDRGNKTDRGFSNKTTTSSSNKGVRLSAADKPDLLNFKKGWMSILGDSGEWKKHWFVLTDSSLRYYRDSTAEEANELDGEIDLQNCSNVTEYQVQRNYGFQIHTKELVYTLSAMTSGIRRNWIEALKKNVRPNSSPDVTKRNSWTKAPSSKASSTDSNKENTFCDMIGRRTAVRSEPAATVRTRPDAQRGSRRTDGLEQLTPAQDCVELEPVQGSIPSSRTPAPPLPPRQDPARADELQRGQAQRIAERSRWFESPAPGESPRRGTDWSFIPVFIPEPLSKDVEVKWQELERIPLRDHKQVPLACLRPSQSNLNDNGTSGTTERLKKELDEARKELESFREHSTRLQGQRNAAEDLREQVPKGFISQATCERSFKEMEESHRKAMEELQRQHRRELERIERDKERLLSEETHATMAAIEAVKKAHREELERELQKVRCTPNIANNSDLERLDKQHQEELQSLQHELQVLSEQYSRKCLEINSQVKETQLREKDLSRSQRENTELLRQNQELNGQLSEEIARIRELVTGRGQDHTANSSGTGDRDSCELEMLLRVKENEVRNLRKETLCLRDELQSMQWDKKYATDRYNDIFVELSVTKVRTERELGQVKEQLRLALSALKEKESLQNSIAK
ncbi:TRIO and F-actin binding protein b isoform X2 [Narcine bancroftii]|uniref:TRIO and F-actin binding protein b isoform X2 n=1 Tax=Narcine bancroftii TaxID=1343680 RepID=UPI003831017B